jgi:hypothetical protein
MKKVNASKKIKSVSEIAMKCKDKLFVDQMINRYLKDTQSAVENIIRMCESVSEMHSAYIKQEIDSYDIDYFCRSVGLEKNKSQYRKYICIGNNAQKFREHIEKIPQAISVLYEITTLNSEAFEILINSGQIRPELTLKEMKELANKPTRKTPTTRKVSQLQTISISFDSSNLSRQARVFLAELILQVQKIHDFELDANTINKSWITTMNLESEDCLDSLIN